MFNSSSSNHENWSDFNDRFGKEGRKSKMLSHLIGVGGGSSGGGSCRNLPGKSKSFDRALPRGMSGRDLMRSNTSNSALLQNQQQSSKRSLLSRSKSLGGHKTKIGGNTSGRHSLSTQAA